MKHPFTTKYPTICEMLPVDNRTEFFRRVLRADWRKRHASLVATSTTLIPTTWSKTILKTP